MIDLVIVQTDELPANALDWHERNISFNTIFLTIWGPNPVTGRFTGKLMHVKPITSLFDVPIKGGSYYYRHSNGNVLCSSSLKKVPRKYRQSAINLKYETDVRKYTTYLTDKVRGYFNSLEEIKGFMLSDDEIADIKKQIAGLYPSPVVSYKGTL